MALKSDCWWAVVVMTLVMAFVTLDPGVALAKPAVTSVRAGDNDSFSRFVMEVSEELKFRVHTQAEPYRVVIDLPDLDWSAASAIKPVGVIKGFRFGTATSGGGRITIDLAGPAAVKQAFMMSPREGLGWRFVLDLTPSTREAFAKSLNPPPAEASAPPASAKITPAAVTAPSAQVLVAPKAEPVAPAPRAEPVAPRAEPVAVTSPPPSMDAKKAKPTSKPIVVIDAGHGGQDPGAISSFSGVYEKDLMLTYARALRSALERTGRVKVVMTRDTDIFIPLRERVQIARSAGADLFISLHANVLARPDVRGLSVFTLSQNASDAEAQALADAENKADLIGGVDLTNDKEVNNILIDLMQRETMNLSAAFATTTVDEVRSEARLLQNTHRFAGFAVLKAPDTPSILVEVGYLSNKDEEMQLRRPEYQAKLTGAMARAVVRYFDKSAQGRRP